MDLIVSKWLTARKAGGAIEMISPLDLVDPEVLELCQARPDFQIAAYQFLVGLVQTACPPEDRDEWWERLHTPLSRAELERALEGVREAFLLENEGGAAFLQDLKLEDARDAGVTDLIFEQGSDVGRFYAKPRINVGFCPNCVALGLMNLQCHAPSGGRGTRTSLRGGGPITTLLVSNDDDAPLWQRTWLNVIPADELGYEPISRLADVFPWLAPTRTSERPEDRPTFPTDVHPLQAYWGMPRRIRLDWNRTKSGSCGICGAPHARLLHGYRTRHGGVNYEGPWLHPLTPYTLDEKHEKPPLSRKGQPGGIGYRDWLALTFGVGEYRLPASAVSKAIDAGLGELGVRLWASGGDFDNIKLRSWHDSVMPVVAIEAEHRPLFVNQAQHLIDAANATAKFLGSRVREAWDTEKSDPAVVQSLWDETEGAFFVVIDDLARTAGLGNDAERGVIRGWLRTLRNEALRLFDRWTIRGPLETLDLERVVKARGGLAGDLHKKKPLSDLWKYTSEPVEAQG